jgi:tripartite-type tricarboxylate transporter receptor subunit TctC
MKRFAALVIGIFLATTINAQGYPDKPVRLVVGYSAGGPTDVIARIVAQDMAASLGQGVVVENKTGANGLIGTMEVKKAPADGYTILMTTLSHNVNAILLADKKPYDPQADFAPVSIVALLPLVLVAKGDSPLASVGELIRVAKAKPNEVSYASAGNGGSAHLAGALLATLSQTQMTHVPFRGNAPALTEVMAGRVTFMFYPMIGIADHVAQKRLKVLGVSTAASHPDYPGVPTMAEAGFPGFEEYTQGLGLVAPAGTPAAAINRLNGAIRASLEKAQTRERLKGLGAITQSSSPAEFSAWLKKDAERWERVIKTAGVKAD